MRAPRHGPAVAAVLLGALLPALAQTVSGRLFEDRDADGILDPGEPVLVGVPVGLFGTRAGGAPFDAVEPTGPSGDYAFAAGDGTFVIDLADPAGWRLGPARFDGVPESTPGYVQPVGRLRLGKLDQGVDHLRAGSLGFYVLGDSIAVNFNSFVGCSSGGDYWYNHQVRERLGAAAPAAATSLIGGADLGQHTDDLLDDDFDSPPNNVFRAIDAQPELVTISAIGNDLLDVDAAADPTQAQINVAVAEILDSRANLQEALSALVSEIPGADIALNTLYDNEADTCATTSFHRQWVPLLAQMLRDLAWGQARRVSIVEAQAEFAHEGQAGACDGFTGLICHGLFDGIHPTNAGYAVVREKLWEAVGGLALGPADGAGRTSHLDADFGFLRRVRRLLPTTWEALGGATVGAPEAALSDDDGGAAARIHLGVGSGEIRLAGFPDYLDEMVIVKVVAGVRYHTDGVVVDNLYRMEASVDDQFRPPPGFDYSPTAWNFYTPLVGGGGPNMPPENPDYPDARLLVVPDVAAPREVSATLTKDPVLPPGSDHYEWPAVTHMDLATATIRVAAAPVAAAPVDDGSTVELDAAWLDVYGWEKPRPPEVSGLEVRRQVDASLELTFDALAGAARYNVYFGRLSALGAYDHGSGAPAPPLCDHPTAAAGGGRLAAQVPEPQQPGASAYVLVTAHVDGVESPSGAGSSGTEIDRSQSICR